MQKAKVTISRVTFVALFPTIVIPHLENSSLVRDSSFKILKFKMKTLPDFDPQDDDESPRVNRNHQDPEERMANMAERIQSDADYFHDEWSRRNPNQVYGQSFRYY